MGVNVGEPDGGVTRAEFEALCLVVELLIAMPGGMLDLTHLMGWEAKGILDTFAKMRMHPPLFAPTKELT